MGQILRVEGPRWTRQRLCMVSTSSASAEPASSLTASRLGLDPGQNRIHAPFVYHEEYSFENWPESHTFPMDKFRSLAQTLTTKYYNDNNTQFDRPGTSSQALVRRETDFFRPLDFEDVPISHWIEPIMEDSEYLYRFLSGTLTTEEARYIGFREQTTRTPLIRRTVLEVAGTVLACQLALKYGIAANLAGGTHHAHPNGGAGYTIINDLAVAAYCLTHNKIQSHKSGPVSRVLVIDCDVHQGDGTAKFGQTENLRDRLFTLSFHCASNYPQLKANSTFDVGLDDGVEDEEYMEILQKHVAHAIRVIQPDFVLYDAGVDIYAKDKLGRLKVSEDGIRQRDRWVMDYCVSKSIPVAAVIGGGYDKDVKALARRHAIVHEEASSVWRKYKLWNVIE